MIKSRNGICPNCNKSYLKKRSDQKYCSTDCRVEHNNQVLKEKYKSIKTLKRNQKQTDKEYQGKEKELLDKIEQLQAELEYIRIINSKTKIIASNNLFGKEQKIDGRKFIEIDNDLNKPLYLIHGVKMYEIWDSRVFKER